MPGGRLPVRGRCLTFEAYRDWHARMLSDLVAIMNGENADPTDDFAYKLVFTGEDYPFSERFGDRVAFFARDAVEAGMGIRNGISELFNFHLGEIPAYGTTIGADGHLSRTTTGSSSTGGAWPPPRTSATPPAASARAIRSTR